MLKLYPMFSGSSGNMYCIKSETATILVDFGVSYKAGKDGLSTIEQDIQSIDALFVTHEHIDHIKGIKMLLKNTSFNVYATKETLACISNNTADFSRFLPVEYEQPITIKDMVIIPFKVSHDAVMPAGYSISSDGRTITIATDLGYVDNDIFSHLKSSSFCVIESNYDKELLKYGGYPYPLKERIASSIGHLSNSDASDTILKLAQNGNRNFLLGHISENNNEPNIAKTVICDTLRANGFNTSDFSIDIATRKFSDEVYIV